VGLAWPAGSSEDGTVQLPGLVARARTLWEGLAGAPIAFDSAVRVAVSRQSLLCPPGWVGIVVIDREAIVTAPDQDTARTVQDALAGLPAAALTDAAVLGARLPVLELLGPATLAYLTAGEFRRQPGQEMVEVIPARSFALRQFLSAIDPMDVEESGLAEITSPAFTVRAQRGIAAAAGYHDWPGQVAHLSVLTAAPARGRGYARLSASAAVTHALLRGKLPQWRAQALASRRIARSLGFRELGAQVSIYVQAWSRGQREIEGAPHERDYEEFALPKNDELALPRAETPWS
jgi:GNAT acetyltransferase